MSHLSISALVVALIGASFLPQGVLFAAPLDGAPSPNSKTTVAEPLLGEPGGQEEDAGYMLEGVQYNELDMYRHLMTGEAKRYKSNSIAQHLGEDAETDWYVLEWPNLRILYEGDEERKFFERSEERSGGYLCTVTTEREAGQSDTVKTYRAKEDGRIIKVVDEDMIDHVYYYSPEGRLISIKSTRGTRDFGSTVFFRDSQTGELFGSRSVDEQGNVDYMFISPSKGSGAPETLVRGTGEGFSVYETYFGSLTKTTRLMEGQEFSPQKGVTWMPDGSLVVDTPTGKDVYDPQGRLVQKGSNTFEYTPENVLTLAKDSQEGMDVLTFFDENGKKKKSEYSRKGERVKDIELLLGGDYVETIYHGGQEYARVTYDMAGTRVREVEYI